MKLTEAMRNTIERVGGSWKDEGDGYFSLIGQGCFHMVAYIKLPEGHIDIGKHYTDFDEEPQVNGGLTFSREDVFGLDYGHFRNDTDVITHIKNAIQFFKEREKRLDNEN